MDVRIDSSTFTVTAVLNMFFMRVSAADCLCLWSTKYLCRSGAETAGDVGMESFALQLPWERLWETGNFPRIFLYAIICPFLESDLRLKKVFTSSFSNECQFCMLFQSFSIDILVLMTLIFSCIGNSGDEQLFVRQWSCSNGVWHLLG